MQPSLEQIAQSAEPAQNKQGCLYSLYKYAIDTFAMVSFSTPIGMANEILVAGMSVNDSIKVRIMSAIGCFVTARPYGKFRNFVFRKCGVDDTTGFVKKTTVDTLASAIFQTPLYTGILIASGADTRQTIVGATSMMLVAGLTGRPYGAYRDFCMKRCGIKPEYEDKIE
ncbi:L-alanine exporter AlaE [Candidatus Pacearchaeota archaeon]|nr:L-alanine exporter AlaE [Candidatus Pacearchaeota archaeon]